MGLGLDIGIDLGTSSVLIYVRGKGVVLTRASPVFSGDRTVPVGSIGRHVEDHLIEGSAE